MSASDEEYRRIGSAAGFYGRPLDDVLMRFTEVVQVAPRFFLAVLVAALFGPNLWHLALLIGQREDVAHSRKHYRPPQAR